MSNFITISYRNVSGSYFPSIVSDEAMTGAAMRERTGASFQEAHVSVRRHGMFQRFWHFADLVKTRDELLRRQLEHNVLPQYTETVRKHFDSAMNLLDVDLMSQSSEDLWRLYSAACSEYRNMCVYTYVANLLDRPLAEAIQAGLEELESSRAQRDEYLLKLTRNPAANFMYNHDLDLINLLQTAATDEQIQGHVDKWKTLFNGGGGNSGAEDVKERIKTFHQLSPGALEDKKKRIEHQYAEAATDIEEIESALGASRELREKFALMRDCILLKETRKFCMTQLEDAVLPLFATIGKAINLRAEHVGFLLPDELEKALFQGGSILSDEVIEAFKEDLCFVIKSGVVERFTGPSVDEMIEKYQLGDEIKPSVGKTEKQDAASPPRVYSGFVSCLGFAEGPVKIVLGKEDFHKIEPGDILVTSITTPEYIAIFDMVRGMVTFDGAGITSHPATLSREYKIPAILGIKELIGVLHDEDVISVDANNNIVKIIERRS